MSALSVISKMFPKKDYSYYFSSCRTIRLLLTKAWVGYEFYFHPFIFFSNY